MPGQLYLTIYRSHQCIFLLLFQFSAKDPWFVISLVDFYIQSQSRDALDILFQISEPHDRQILDRLCELMKGNHRLQALMLCGQLVQKQVPWIYNITKHNIFPYIIKIMKV